ncbi:MAG: hypothetical protein ACC628_08935 [Pirellulaceae bacterium]
MRVCSTRRHVRWTTGLLRASIMCMLGLILAEQAFAVPIFSRKYRTSCITCHAGFPKLNSVGEAFRRNGYQFPGDDEVLVKDEPVPLGNDSYKDMFPNALWPNDIPHLPPVAFRMKLGYNQFLDRQSGDSPTSDFQFPNDFSLLTAGTLGPNISWYGSMTLAGKGGHGGGGGHGGESGGGLEPDLERAFVQFSNLFAWSDEDDDDGMRLGSRWIAVPRHLLNLRIGQFEPQVIAPYASIHRQLGTTGRLPNVVTMGGNSFGFEPAQRGIELHGTWRQNNSYAVGLVNGNGAEAAWDNNTQKDVYFRVARKWWGFPWDGEIGQAELVDDGSDDEGESEEPDEDEMPPMSLDFWREVQFETGFFGFFGRNEASVTIEQEFDVALVGSGSIPMTLSRTFVRPDRFERIGFDSRMQFQDLDIFGSWIWGWDRDPISDEAPDLIERDRLFTWFVEADYYFYPWLIGYGRYEQVSYGNDERQAENAISRGVVGAAAYIRTNMRLVTEVVGDAQGNGTTGDTLNLLLDFAY